MRRISLGLAAGATTLALAASPVAAPIRHAASVTLSKPSFTTKWHESHFLSGKLILKGKATEAATVRVGWFAQSLLSQRKPRYGASGPQTVQVNVKRGTFKKTVTFKTAYYPGTFVLAGYASGASGLVSLAGRSIKMPAPIEGIVGKVTTRTVGRAGVFATFTFAPNALPRSRTVRETFFEPGGCPKNTSCSRVVRAAPTLHVNAKATGTPLKVGFWRCVLSSSGKQIAEADFHVG